jgi:hypothetical protein
VFSPAESVELLTQRLAALANDVEEIRATVRTATEQQVPWVFLIEEEYRLGLLEAEQRFVTGLIESLKQPDYDRLWHEFFGSKE